MGEIRRWHWNQRHLLQWKAINWGSNGEGFGFPEQVKKTHSLLDTVIDWLMVIWMFDDPASGCRVNTDSTSTVPLKSNQRLTIRTQMLSLWASHSVNLGALRFLINIGKCDIIYEPPQPRRRLSICPLRFQDFLRIEKHAFIKKR